MSGWQIGLMLKPLLILAFMIVIVFPIKWLILKVIPEGRIKRILLFSWKV